MLTPHREMISTDVAIGGMTVVLRAGTDGMELVSRSRDALPVAQTTRHLLPPAALVADDAALHVGPEVEAVSGSHRVTSRGLAEPGSDACLPSRRRNDHRIAREEQSARTCRVRRYGCRGGRASMWSRGLTAAAPRSSSTKVSTWNWCGTIRPVAGSLILQKRRMTAG